MTAALATPEVPKVTDVPVNSPADRSHSVSPHALFAAVVMAVVLVVVAVVVVVIVVVVVGVVVVVTALVLVVVRT